MPEQGLDLGGVGVLLLPQPGGVGVAQPVRAQALDTCVGADGEDDLGEAGDRQRSALPEEQPTRTTRGWAAMVGAVDVGVL